MRRIVIAQSAEEIARLRPTWEQLPAPTIFQSFLWNHTAASVFGDRECPHVIYAESDSGAALIPAAVSGSGLTLLGETLFDYRDVLASLLDRVGAPANDVFPAAKKIAVL